MALRRKGWYYWRDVQQKETKGFNFKLLGSSKQNLEGVESSENALQAEALVGQEHNVGESRLGRVLVVWLLYKFKQRFTLKSRI